jgi:UDP-N-acetylmuramoylalanine--D-glutamate ligase
MKEPKISKPGSPETKAIIQQKARALMSDIAYRLETVALMNDVEIINDSKSTDLFSTHYSLELMDKPVVWIAGASEFEEDYTVIHKLVKYKVKSLIIFGKCEPGLKLMKEMHPMVDHLSWYNTLDLAVVKAWSLCRKGDAMLFSPACPSFEMFEDFRQRGQIFNRLIETLK